MPHRALVTGASGGLGAALAGRLAERGLEVWLCARRLSVLETQAAAIRARGGNAHAVRLDLEAPDEVAKTVARIDDESGGIDLVIANGAVTGPPASIPASRLTWENVRHVVDVNVAGTLATLVPFIPRMIARGKGHLVGISSLAAYSPMPRAAVYGASKAALSHFLDGIGMELRPQGVAVTVIEPGFIRTPATEQLDDPLPFIVDTADAVDRIDRAIQRRARRLAFPWQLGALQAVPRLLPAAVRDAVMLRVTREG